MFGRKTLKDKTMRTYFSTDASVSSLGQLDSVIGVSSRMRTFISGGDAIGHWPEQSLMSHKM